MKILNKIARKHKNNENPTKIEFLHDSLLIDESILVLGDLHIGYEEHIAEAGIFPRVQLREILSKLKDIFWNISMQGKKIKQVIILGDLKHEFGGISDIEWSETIKFLDYLDEQIAKDKDEKKENDRIILIKGNHDTILGPIAKKKGVALRDFYRHKEICFMHGNKLHGNCFEKSKILILGHLHPAITLKDNYKKEKYKCFLHGKWKKKEVYIIPSFSPIGFGYELNSIEQSRHNNEFLIIKYNLLENFEVVIYNSNENKEYNFGKLKKLI
ncbi:Calcineurin-like phosphoesterase [uncultured archaeon]|nr:Calcineurin-like phosphoesterase [uncultured archaeon]